MKDLSLWVMEEAKRRGVQFADIRIIENEVESIETENGGVSEIGRYRSVGFGIRVLMNGSWGFSSSSKADKHEMEKVLSEAISIAKASSLAKKEDVVLSPVEVYQDEVPHNAKIDLLRFHLIKNYLCFLKLIK